MSESETRTRFRVLRPGRRFRRWGAFLAALALLFPAGACGVGEEAVLWSLDGRELRGGEDVLPTVWATGPTVAIARARDVAGYDAATGERRWTVPLSSEVCAVSSRPEGGRIAVRFGEERIGCHRVALIDLRTGKKVWEETITPNDPIRSGQVVIGEGVVVVDWRYSTTAFRLDDGKPLWTIDSRGADCEIDVLSGGPVLLAGRTCEDESRSVHRLDPRNGRHVWSYDVPPGYEVAAMVTTRRVVLGLRGSGRGVSRFVVLDPSGAPVTSIDMDGGDEVRCHHRRDLDRCMNVVVSDDSLYARPKGRSQDKDARAAPVVSHDLSTGRARWSTENPDGNHLYPLAVDGGRLIAAQPRKPGSGGKGGGGGEPPRLVSVDVATGKTSIMWRLPSGLYLSTRYGRQYAQGRLFLNETSVTRLDDDDAVFRAIAKPSE
ncbi:PQQ-binding-like beta-propeller repeat protein [Actinomadura sp. 7K507]|uniref:outer membrane protein assembly factor BamB family protein n=1 Tax=Actinomadura sp. 7K507 TaxID=2530365 RepID=UPI0010435B4A|nr:PQQ-binding-like beta-propeller repeat protein [Actinomadura sp. 7K507]TDC94618.1 hypothetical protein E1285_08365 [Actinomadura sp. 7K507]